MSHIVPEFLLQFQAQLQTTKPGLHTVPYRHDHWQNTLNSHHLASIMERFPTPISRGNIHSLAVAAYNDPSTDALVRLFLAAMVWGYGTVGYGPYRTQKMLAAPELSNILEQTFSSLVDSNVHKAYTSFKLPMCGSAFFTKFFYFAGLGSRQSPRPLILDSVIARRLEERCNLDIKQLARVTRDERGRISSVDRYADGYLRYINLMHEWAEQLVCLPDSIELFLFSLEA